jgi:hypothetical protein
MLPGEARMFPAHSRKGLVVIASLLATLGLPMEVGSSITPPGQQAADVLIGAKKRRPLQGPHRVHAAYRYRVDRRYPVWGVRVLPTQAAAGNFAAHMHRKQFRTRTLHTGKTWQVRFAMLRWHHGRAVFSPIIAQQISLNLQRQGFQTRVVRRLHRVF